MNLSLKSLAVIAAATFGLAYDQDALAQTPPTTPSSGITRPVTEADLANGLYLAHVESIDHITNLNTKRGFYHLNLHLNAKTAVQTDGVQSINIENDDLTFFPVLYWPVTERERTLSENAQKKVQAYIDNGGVIIFDLQTDAAANNGTLKRMLGDVKIGALQKSDNTHTLSRTFYLFTKPEDHYFKGDLWVEQEEFDNPEATSSVIIGQAGWAKAWAGITVQGGSEQYEKAIREGVNFILYSLTGNYKKDLDHNEAVVEKIDVRKNAPK